MSQGRHTQRHQGLSRFSMGLAHEHVNEGQILLTLCPIPGISSSNKMAVLNIAVPFWSVTRCWYPSSQSARVLEPELRVHGPLALAVGQ